MPVVPSHRRSARARRGGGSPLPRPGAIRHTCVLGPLREPRPCPWNGGEKERERLLLLASLVVSFSHKTWQTELRMREWEEKGGEGEMEPAVEEKRKKSHQSRMLSAPTLETTATRPSVTGHLVCQYPVFCPGQVIT